MCISCNEIHVFPKHTKMELKDEFYYGRYEVEVFKINEKDIEEVLSKFPTATEYFPSELDIYQWKNCSNGEKMRINLIKRLDESSEVNRDKIVNNKMKAIRNTIIEECDFILLAGVYEEFNGVAQSKKHHYKSYFIYNMNTVEFIKLKLVI